MTTSRDEQLPDAPAELLAFARERRKQADQAEADLLQAAVQWAITHPAESIEEAATIHLRSFGDTAIPVAGPGAPLVAEFSIAEYAAAIGLPTEAGKRYLGHALELRYRLPKLWKRVTTGDLAAWKARRIADQTLHLSIEAARYVDRHVAPVAHKIRPTQVDRLVEEAIARHMPEEAEERRRQAWDQTHLTINHHGVGIAGTSIITGEIDLADALDLDDAVRAEAQHLADLGNTKTLDQRRALAIGNIARRDLVLDYPNDTSDTTSDTTADTPAEENEPRSAKPDTKTTKRTTVLHLHLSESAVRGTCTCTCGGQTADAAEIGRVENTRSPVTAETIRQWCGRPDATIVVKPVIDLAEHVSVEAYEVPDRIAEPVALRDVSCIFPWCTRPARKLRPDEHPCDNDHPVPYHQGGPTCSCQIAPLCRRHHRLKTHGGWTYHVLEPGTYLWTSPHAYQYLRDHTGTLDVSRDKHRCQPPPADTPPPGET
jgi:hypothetical protein